MTVHPPWADGWARADRWLVEHCVGPLGVGTLIVKPIRHVTAAADLTDDEAAGAAN